MVVAGARKSGKDSIGAVLALPPGDVEAALALRNRYYNPEIGRFNRLDPFSGITQEPLSLHKYNFGEADPVNNIDPSGLVSLTGTVVSAGISSGLISLGVGAVFRVPKFFYDVFYAEQELSNALFQLAQGLATDFALGAVLGGGGAGLARFLPNAVKLRAVGQSIAGIKALRLPGSVWNIAGNKIRGLAIEKAILSRPAAFLGRQIKNFPVIDDYIIKGGRGIATSIKSLDLTRSSYQTASGVYNRLNNLARPLQNFTQRTRQGLTVGGANTPVTDKVLVVAMEQGAASSAQAQGITRFLREASANFPDVKVVLQFVP